LGKIKDSFSSKIKVPFFSPWITKSDVHAVIESLHSTQLTDGPKLRQFEDSFAKFTGAKFAIGVSNATTALHLSLKAVGIGIGDEVILPDMTFVATANAVIQSGAIPVFVDVDKATMNISVESAKRNIGPKTRAILPVHFAGKACEMDDICNLARKNKLLIIEDCAHAIGTRYKKKHVGNFGIAGCFSFYPTKNITTIEGGMIITNSKAVANYVSMARNHGITKSLSQRYSHGKPWDYEMSEPGYNYRLDEVRASLGINQLKRILRLNLLRKKAFEYYNKGLQNIDGVITPSTSRQNIDAYHLYIIRIEKRSGITRDELFKKLLHYGIRTTVHYKPLHKFLAYKNFANHMELRNSDELYDEIISLPFYPNISRVQQDYVIKCIADIIEH